MKSVGEHGMRPVSIAEPVSARRARTMKQERILGIVGGVGPYAHLEFERCLLKAMGATARDQDYPAWLLSSIPATPSFAQAIFASGPSPVPALLRSLERLHPVADFAVIACNTAHIFFDDIEPRSPLPLVHMVAEVVTRLVALVGEDARVGVLGVSAMLESRLYPKVAQRLAPGLEWVGLQGLDDGHHLQEALTMGPIYGHLLGDGSRVRDGIKFGSAGDSETGRLHRDALEEAVDRPHAAGARCVVAGCTEISVSLGDSGAATVMVDPLKVAAEVALAIAYGERELPRQRSASASP